MLLGEGQSFVNSSAELNATDYLIEGVIGSIT